MGDGAESPGDQVTKNKDTGAQRDKTAADPVILSTGNFSLSETDFNISGGG